MQQPSNSTVADDQDLNWNRAQPEPGRVRGRVLWFKAEKGFGFIRPDGGGDDGKDDLYAHYSEIKGAGYRTLQTGQIVEFEIHSRPGRPANTAAKNIAVIEGGQ